MALRYFVWVSKIIILTSECILYIVLNMHIEKSPLTPLYERGEFVDAPRSPFEKGGFRGISC